MIFSIDLTAGQFLRVTEFGTLDVLIHILGTTCGATACNASVDGGETGPGALYQAPTTGTYYVAVESFSGTPSAASTYDVRFEVITPVCGNGTIELGEQCDDGQATPMGGDGCSATCQVETGFVCTGTPSVCASVLPGCAGTVIIANASGLPTAIPDNQPAGGAVFPINVSQMGTITNMAMGFSATHTWTGDVRVYVTGPDAVERNVCLNRGGSGDNFSGTIFRDVELLSPLRRRRSLACTPPSRPSRISVRKWSTATGRCASPTAPPATPAT
jgi:cysteine-rich repeat protein